MFQSLGNFHPLLVHLPIGILLIACLFQWLVVKEKYKKLQPAVGIMLFWGMLFAIFSCISGLILSQSGDYEGDLVLKHQWLGIAVAVVSIIQYYLFRKSINTSFAKWLALVLAILISLAGHFGGSLTHGEDYLTKAFSSGNDQQAGNKKVIPDVQNAMAYSDIIQPILNAKCYGCHGANKQKGKLRLDLPDYILKGGEEGNTLIAGDPAKSELIKRILLARNDEDHMPPKEKPQLTEDEVALLHWWVQSGAALDKKVNQLNQPEKLQPILLALQSASVNKEVIVDIPEKEITAADQRSIDAIRQRGITILPVKQNSNYLQVNFLNVDSVNAKDIELLLPIKEQLIWLKISDQPIGDDAINAVATLRNIRKLFLDRTAITDQSFQSIKQLDSLHYLNLVGTKISAKGLLELKGLKKLKTVYTYQTNITGADWNILTSAFPATKVDTGNYVLPMLESDTTLVREKTR